MVRGREPGRRFAVDFGLALTRSAVASDAEFARACEEDMPLLTLLAEEADRWPERGRRSAGRRGGGGADSVPAHPDQDSPRIPKRSRRMAVGRRMRHRLRQPRCGEARRWLGWLKPGGLSEDVQSLGCQS